MDPYLGEIQLFPYMPLGRTLRGWHLCDGSLLQVTQNQALFSLLGNAFGGDGRTTFALPDLRGRVPMGMDARTALNRPGVAGGSESVVLTLNQMPSHTHIVAAVNQNANASNCQGAYPAIPIQSASTQPPVPNCYAPAASGSVAQLDTSAVSSAGASAKHENRQPSVAMGYYIAVSGIYPPRD